jgi:hypothetical protein
MKWLKLSNNVTTDSKLALIAAKSKSYRHEVIALWIHLLCVASQKENRGKLGDLDFEEIDYLLEFLSGKSQKIYNEMQQRLLDGDQIINWSEYQADPTARDRQRRSRLKRQGKLNEYESKEKIFERDDYKCVYCLSDDNLTLDHMLPITRGGSDSVSNLVTACKKCNFKKNNKTPDEAGYIFQSLIARDLWKSHPCHSDKCNSHAVTVEESRVEEIIEVRKVKNTKKEKNYPEEFEAFWKTYPPNAASKAKAFESWQKSINNGATHDILTRAAGDYGSYLGRTGYEAAHATTWLNQERWTVRYEELGANSRLNGGGSQRAAPGSGKTIDEQAASVIARIQANALSNPFEERPEGAGGGDKDSGVLLEGVAFVRQEGGGL